MTQDRLIQVLTGSIMLKNTVSIYQYAKIILNLCKPSIDMKPNLLIFPPQNTIHLPIYIYINLIQVFQWDFKE